MPSAAQRKNLLKLAVYLESLPADYKHFGMDSYADHRGVCDLPMEPDIYAAKKPVAFLANCGTVACAVGHGPAAGIKPKADEFVSYGSDSGIDFSWGSYAERVFGTDRFGLQFYFLFAGSWKNVDDHHYGAAARIRYYLATGNLHAPYDENVTRKYAPYCKGSRSTTRREIEQVSA